MFISFSPNMLKTYELCSKKFYYKYVEKISIPINDDIYELGKNIHALASYYLRKENIYKMELSLSEKEKEIWEYLKNVKYLSYEGINSEYNLSLKLGEYFFGGRLDALVKDEDERFYILDYKTGSAPKNAKYDYQTMIYMLAVSAFFKTSKISFIYIDLRNKLETKLDLTEELVGEYEKKLLEIANKINSEIYIKKSSECKCEYNNICY